MVPDAGGDDPAGHGDPGHLPDAGDRVAHEVDDELGQRRVEGVVGVGQLLGGAAAHVGGGQAGVQRRDERRGRVDGRHVLLADPADQLGAQRPRASPDVQHPLPAAHLREVGQAGGEAGGEAAHEPAVGVGGDLEAHPRTIDPRRGVDREPAGTSAHDRHQ